MLSLLVNSLKENELVYIKKGKNSLEELRDEISNVKTKFFLLLENPGTKKKSERMKETAAFVS